MESIKQWTKPLIPVTKWGASTHPEVPTHYTVNRNSWTPCNPLLKMWSLWPKLDQVASRLTNPQHSHVTHPQSLSYNAFDLCCDAIIDNIVLLDYLCYLLFLSMHFFQQCLYGWSGILMQHLFLPLSYLPEPFIYYLQKLEGVILPLLSPLYQDLLFPMNIFNLFLNILPFSDVGKLLQY